MSIFRDKAMILSRPMAIAALSLILAACSSSGYTTGSERYHTGTEKTGKTTQEAPVLDDYVGTWKCIAFEDDMGYTTIDDLIEKENHSYSFDVVLREDGIFCALVNDDGRLSPWVSRWWDWQQDGSRGYMSFVGLGDGDHPLALKGQDGTTFYFDRVSDSQRPLCAYLQFPGFAMQVPIELLDSYNSKLEEAGGLDAFLEQQDQSLYPPDYGNCSVMVDVARFYDGQYDPSSHVGGEKHVVDGVEMYVSTSTDSLWETKTQFILDGILYEVRVAYYSGEAETYEDYANSAYQTIKFGDFVGDIENYIGQPNTNDRSEDWSGSVPDGSISYQEVINHVGETVSFYGMVMDSEYRSESNQQPTYIDVGAAYPDTSRVSMVVWGDDRGNFPGAPEDIYLGKIVCVTGEIYEYEGVAYVKVTTPDQVRILD